MYVPFYIIWIYQTRLAKILWTVLVCLGFITAGYLISKSYNEWQASPIATSITTHPIDDLDFPVVTICPPKDSDTALYHDLVKVGNGTLPDYNKEKLKRASYKIFLDQAHKDYVKKMKPLSHMGNSDQTFKGFHSMPTPHKSANSFEIRMWNLNGTITTPWFGEDFVEEYYKEDREFHFVLELPKDIKNLIGSGSLTIELEFNSRLEKEWIEQASYKEIEDAEFKKIQDSTYTFHKSKKNWTEAEAECQRNGGHLASVTSNELYEELKDAFGSVSVWLGGRRELGKWSWSDNSTWGFTKWAEGHPYDTGD